jgi:hypothetical protein
MIFFSPGIQKTFTASLKTAAMTFFEQLDNGRINRSFKYLTGNGIYNTG